MRISVLSICLSFASAIHLSDAQSAPVTRRDVPKVQTVLVLGDSLAAGYRLERAQAFPALLAKKAGATGFTHLGNACPQLLNRHDNILWRALDTPGLTVSLIPDQVHVSPPLFRLFHRALMVASAQNSGPSRALADLYLSPPVQDCNVFDWKKGPRVLIVTTNDLPGSEIQRVCGEVFG